MALLHIITFLIHAIAAAFASLALAVLSHMLPVLLLAVLGCVAVVLLCTSCGIGGAAMFRQRKRRQGNTP